MVLEELTLVVESGGDGLLRVDVTLPTVDDGHIAESQWDDASGKDINDVGALVPVCDVKGLVRRLLGRCRTSNRPW
jgi:hypothetical protein